MSEYLPTVLTGLSLSIAGIVLFAVVDEASKTARIGHSGQVMNGEAAAVQAAMEVLAGRVKRVRPDLKVIH